MTCAEECQKAILPPSLSHVRMETVVAVAQKLAVQIADLWRGLRRLWRRGGRHLHGEGHAGEA